MAVIKEIVNTFDEFLKVYKDQVISQDKINQDFDRSINNLNTNFSNMYKNIFKAWAVFAIFIIAFIVIEIALIVSIVFR